MAPVGATDVPPEILTNPELAVNGAEPAYVVLGEILMFAAVSAPEPMSIDALRLVTMMSAAAVKVLEVVLLIAPLDSNSMFPDVA